MAAISATGANRRVRWAPPEAGSGADAALQGRSVPLRTAPFPPRQVSVRVTMPVPVSAMIAITVPAVSRSVMTIVVPLMASRTVSVCGRPRGPTVMLRRVDIRRTVTQGARPTGRTMGAAPHGRATGPADVGRAVTTTVVRQGGTAEHQDQNCEPKSCNAIFHQTPPFPRFLAPDTKGQCLNRV
jgi:hypothetical protein